jgi:hypothetical protein
MRLWGLGSIALWGTHIAEKAKDRWLFLFLAGRFVKRDFNWLKFEEDFDINVEVEGLVVQPSV